MADCVAHEPFLYSFVFKPQQHHFPVTIASYASRWSFPYHLVNQTKNPQLAMSQSIGNMLSAAGDRQRKSRDATVFLTYLSELSAALSDLIEKLSYEVQDAAVSGEIDLDGATILDYIDYAIQLQSEIKDTMQSLLNSLTGSGIHYGGNTVFEIRSRL
ncbi:hypothetical protein BDV33DRAFT_209487 [Aspergillus novoparasiticus]|uniref:Uncharacterized protein n=1 Tax=Aspergillus novoparasiticus TaxID=986946 RepID=A0A5N6EAV3_9EURO|nr:hypothetical protein BDV33DRAFT_209487 [Aspergillus novoparasiticus]